MKYILCYSGGKDSTAMLIKVLQNNMPLDEILYVDVGGWIWETAPAHIKKVEQKLNVNITILNVEDEIKQGFKKWGFPSFINRWCTGIKREAMKKYLKNKYPNEDITQYIGYCADENKRTNKKLYSAYGVKYPLVELGITTNDALKICVDAGFDFGGVYKHHSHFNCWLCPLQRINELEYIYIYMPDLWEHLRELQKQTDGTFAPGLSVFQLEHKFWYKQKDYLKKKRLDARQK